MGFDESDFVKDKAMLGRKAGVPASVRDTTQAALRNGNCTDVKEGIQHKRSAWQMTGIMEERQAWQ